jgi:flavin reductase (DIM6/NTAB) family NADH-FMN oxidoreductase RutF
MRIMTSEKHRDWIEKPVADSKDWRPDEASPIATWAPRSGQAVNDVSAVVDRLVVEFRTAMRQLAGGVSIISVGRGHDRSGLTVTSASSLSADPPTVIVCVNRGASSWPILDRYRAFGVNVLAATQRSIAEKFAGKGGASGNDRYAGAEWFTLATGTPLLVGALAAIDCEVEEMIDRHSHSIVIGCVLATRVDSSAGALTYWQGCYRAFASADASSV